MEVISAATSPASLRQSLTTWQICKTIIITINKDAIIQDSGLDVHLVPKCVRVNLVAARSGDEGLDIGLGLSLHLATLAVHEPPHCRGPHIDTENMTPSRHFPSFTKSKHSNKI